MFAILIYYFLHERYSYFGNNNLLLYKNDIIDINYKIFIKP